jgi:DNA-binding MurR/RpiR family transcriptional regulator
MIVPDWSQRLDLHQDKLSRKECELIAWVNANPHRAAFLKLNELVEAAGISKPTIISCYRNLGFGDYQDFQACLQDFYAGQIDSYRASQLALADIASLDQLVQASLDVELATLEIMRKNLDAGQLGQLVTQLLGAGAIHVYGDGTGFYPGHYLVQRLRSCGLSAFLAGTDREHVMDDLSPVGPGDAFLIFNYTQDHATLCAAMDFCRSRGAVVILVTGFLEPELCRRADLRLFVPRGKLEFKNSMAMPMAFAQVLLLGIEYQGGPSFAAKLRSIGMQRTGMRRSVQQESRVTPPVETPTIQPRGSGQQ